MKPPAWRSYDDDDGGGSDDGGSGSSPSTVDGGVTYELRYFKTEEQAREGVKQCGVIEMNSIRNVTGGKADDETSISLHAGDRLWHLRLGSLAEQKQWLGDVHLLWSRTLACKKPCPEA